MRALCSLCRSPVTLETVVRDAEKVCAFVLNEEEMQLPETSFMDTWKTHIVSGVDKQYRFHCVALIVLALAL